MLCRAPLEGNGRQKKGKLKGNRGKEDGKMRQAFCENLAQF